MLFLRMAGRRLLRSPAMAAAAVATLALGVGANASIFAVVEATLLRGLPYPDADRLISLPIEIQLAAGALQIGWSHARYTAFAQARAAPLAATAAWSDAGISISGIGPAERLEAEIASAGYLPLLGGSPALGRGLEDTANPEVVISHELWKRRFAGDPNVLGKTLTANRKVVLTVVGVAPEGFTGLSGKAQLWVPVLLAPRLVFPQALNPRNSWLEVVGKLRPGVPLAQARADLAPVFAATRPGDSTPGRDALKVAALQEARTDPLLRRAALVLLAAVGFLLLLAAANLSNLLLARAAGRERDVAIRRALGAGKAQIVAEFVGEALLLALAGGALGVLLSLWGLDALLALRPAVQAEGFWRNLTPSAVHVSGTVVAFAALVALVAGVSSALPAAIQANRPAVLDALHGRRAMLAGGAVRGLSVRGALVVVQLAIALLLVVGAGLLLRSFSRLRSVDAGFDPAGVVALRLYTPGSQDQAARAQLFSTVLERVSALPGVQAASVDRSMPLSGSGDRTQVSQLEGQPKYEEGKGPDVGIHYVGPQHLAALHARLEAGRFFTDADRAGAARVLVLNATAARTFFPHGAVGRRMSAGMGLQGGDDMAEVIGVIDDVRYGRPHEPVLPEIFASYRQGGFPGTWLFVRAAPGLSPSSIAAQAREVVAALDPELPVSTARTLEQVAADSTAERRFATVLLGVFAVLAMLLSSAGVYGILTVSVEQRRREIGIRRALGAGRLDVVRLVLADSLRLALAGLGIGAALAAASARALGALLHDVPATDPATFAVSALVLAAVAALASALPAWRTAHVEPATAMRAE